MRSIPLVALAAAAATTFALVAASSLTAEAAPTVASVPGITTGVVTAKASTTAASGTQVRVATFNVRTSRADRGTSRHWLKRAVSVAREIKSRNPGIVAIQELGPGRADGKKAKVKNSLRQTDSLERALRSVGAGKYRLVRSTSYVAPGTAHGTQGARILYNTNKYRLISKCRETTGKKNYNSSCSMDMPVKGGDSKSQRRSAAYAEFEDRSTGKNFFVASVHLDNRHSGNLGKEKALDNLRAAQTRAVYNRVKSRAGSKPIIIGADINSWRTKRGSHAPFNALKNRGFRDATAASSRIDARYPTVNHWRRTLKANAKGRQVALDVVMAKGAKSFRKYENVMKVVDSSRPSDHNMVVSDLVL
jgi:endonuclease/exonuclease/phosphatase family metal-dependent hydrolase